MPSFSPLLQFHRQPRGAFQCGQHCVAMLAFVSPLEAIATGFQGKKGSTLTRDVAAALRAYGFQPDSCLRNFVSEDDLPELCILKIRWFKKRNWHWAVYWAGSVYCPDIGIYGFRRIADYNQGALCTSFLRINP